MLNCKDKEHGCHALLAERFSGLEKQNGDSDNRGHRISDTQIHNKVSGKETEHNNKDDNNKPASSAQRYQGGESEHHKGQRPGSTDGGGL
eukprot:4598646-Heterocapsa_arctica.AAC.1